jgi:MFS family permease
MTAESTSDKVGVPPRHLWRNRDFLLLMVGNTASNFGFQAGLVVVPLVAVLTVHATTLQVGLIRMVGQLPYFLFVLFVGVAVDRWRRRNMLVAADIGRAVALAAIPLVYAFYRLGLPILFIVEFVVGLGTVVFDVGSMAYLPRLVEHDQLARGNSEMESARAAALIGGPAIGGLLVSLLMPPRAVIACVAFYLISVITIWRIRKPEPKFDSVGQDTRTLRKIREGLHFVARNPILRATAIITASFNFCYAAYLAIYVVYLPRALHLSGFEIGLAFAALGPGLLVGAIMSSWLPKRLGYGRILLTFAFASNIFLVGISLLHGPPAVTVSLLLLFNFMYGCLSQTFTVALVAIRQSVTPDRFLGRVMATLRFLGVGPVPFGSLFGGLLGTVVGLRGALFSIAIVMCMIPVPFYIFRTALTHIGRELPVVAEA